MQSDERPAANLRAMRLQVSERLFVIVASASALAATDLNVKAIVATPAWAYHYRTGGWFALCAAVLLGALALARVPSRAVAVSAGMLGGGVLGNLISAGVNGDYVPNPIVIGDVHRGVAFNLADVFSLVGIGMLTTSLIAVTLRNRDRLPRPPGWERRLQRRIGL